MVKFSIIIPVYNTKEYLSKCLDSIIHQGFKDFEIILINDGSTDESIQIIDEYTKNYTFIKKIDKKNTGVADTRNIGISYASRTICNIC